MAKRQYSRDFPPGTTKRIQLVIDRIPVKLWANVKAKAKQEGVSLRSLILGWLTDWVG